MTQQDIFSKIDTVCREFRRRCRAGDRPAPHSAGKGRAFFAMAKKRKATNCFEMAIKLARQNGMSYDCARALLDLAAVKKEGREANRREAITLHQSL